MPLHIIIVFCKLLKINGLIEKCSGCLEPQGRQLSIPMKVGIPECYLFSHAQPKPTKEHRVVASGHPNCRVALRHLQRHHRRRVLRRPELPSLQHSPVTAFRAVAFRRSIDRIYAPQGVISGTIVGRGDQVDLRSAATVQRHGLDVHGNKLRAFGMLAGHKFRS
jgi:hypothetical protein